MCLRFNVSQKLVKDLQEYLVGGAIALSKSATLVQYTVSFNNKRCISKEHISDTISHTAVVSQFLQYIECFHCLCYLSSIFYTFT